MMLHHPRLARAVVITLCVATACAAPDFPDPDVNVDADLEVLWAGNPQLAQGISALRDTTDQYHDVDIAFAAGYRPSAAGCEDDETGAMGIHYGKPALLGLVRGS